MAILSIQSAVAYGHVGNAVAVPALQALGLEVWRVDTVGFSNHPGHGRFTGGVRPATEIAHLIEGIDTLGVMGECEAVLSGYLGEAATADAVAGAVEAARRARPDARYVLDPVIGDDGRVFVRDGVPEAIRDSFCRWPTSFCQTRASLAGSPASRLAECLTLSTPLDFCWTAARASS